MPATYIGLTGPILEVVPKAEEPLRMTQSVGNLTAANGVVLELVTLFGNPLIIILRGEELVGTLDLTKIVLEAATRMTKEIVRKVAAQEPDDGQ